MCARNDEKCFATSKRRRYARASGGFPLLGRHIVMAKIRVSAVRLASSVLLVMLVAIPAVAQRPDSARVRRPTTSGPAIPDSLKPPISPRRAFLYSALVPGYGQAILGRNKAAAAMLAIEAMAIAMIRESAADVREARRMSGDTVVVSYVDPTTGTQLTTPAIVSRRFDSQYVHVRQSHVEDWVAFLLANHLFSGADAFVAANLWELPAELSVRVAPGGATVGASLSW